MVLRYIPASRYIPLTKTTNALQPVSLSALAHSLSDSVIGK